jgi:hypothetical protein
VVNEESIDGRILKLNGHIEELCCNWTRFEEEMAGKIKEGIYFKKAKEYWTKGLECLEMVNLEEQETDRTKKIRKVMLGI